MPVGAPLWPQVWDLTSNTCIATLEGHTDGVIALASLGDGRLASGSRDNTIKAGVVSW